MTRFLETYRGVSGSQVVYFTNEEERPVGLSNVTLISSVDAERTDFNIPNPVETWSFDGDSGLTGSQAGNLFVLNTGNKQFGPSPVPGRQALYLNGANRYSVANTSSLVIVGDITVSVFIYPSAFSTNQQNFLQHAGNGETEATNFIYDIRLETNSALRSVVETGAGSNIEITPSPLYSIPPGEWSHVAYRRESGIHSLFHNGRLIHSESAANPTGGGSGQLVIGAFLDDTVDYFGLMYQLKIFDRSISDADLRREAEAVLGTEI